MITVLRPGYELSLGQTLWLSIDLEKVNPPSRRGEPVPPPVVSEVGLSILDLSSTTDDEAGIFEDMASRVQQYHFVGQETLSWPKRHWDKSRPFAAAGCVSQVIPKAELMNHLEKTIRKLTENVRGNVVVLYWDAGLELREFANHPSLYAMMGDFAHWDVQLAQEFRTVFRHKQRASADECLEYMDIPYQFNGRSTQHNAANDSTHTLLKLLCLKVDRADRRVVDLNLVYEIQNLLDNEALELWMKSARSRPFRTVKRYGGPRW